jgi:endonuclease III
MTRFYRGGRTAGTHRGRQRAGLDHPARDDEPAPRAGVKPSRERERAVGGEDPGSPPLPERRSSPARGSSGPDRTSTEGQRASKEPLDIDEIFRRLRRAVADLPKAAMFDLRDRGYASPFEQLVGALISARTRDETPVQVCLRLFGVARTPEEMLALSESELTRLLGGASFAEVKARDIREISRRIVEEWNGQVPDSLEALTSLRGVGPKIAALTLAVGFGRPAIAVDIHVHRIVNRWGYVAASTPEKTMLALAEVLPERYWIEINERLVPFGKSVCTGVRPKCSTCPLLSMCRQVGVTEHR